MIVVDASAALSRVLPSQLTEAAQVFFDSNEPPFLAPQVFVWELCNSLLRFERRGVLTASEAQDAAVHWVGAVDVREPQPAVRAMAFARDARLTLFDAAYLYLAQQHTDALAQQHTDALASRDVALIEAAQRSGVVVHDLRGASAS